MQDYGEFVPYALRASKDKSLSTIGHKMDMFPYGISHYDVGMELVVDNQTHMLVEAYSYLMGLRKEYGLGKSTYILKEQVIPNILNR